MARRRHRNNGQYRAHETEIGNGTGFELENIYECDQPEHALGIVEPDPEDKDLNRPGAETNPQHSECGHFDPFVPAKEVRHADAQRR